MSLPRAPSSAPPPTDRSSMMTCRTVGQLEAVQHVVLLEQLLTRLVLLLRIRLPLHIENVLPRPQRRLRLPVAVQEPLHGERLFLRCERHLIDLTVAGDSGDAFFHMDSVGEVDEVG